MSSGFFRVGSSQNREPKKQSKQNKTGIPQAILSLIDSKWKILILRDLRHGTMRFGQLQCSIGSVSQKVLTSSLRAMEEDGLVHREVYPEVPPRVEYSLTELGLSLTPILDAMENWGTDYKTKHHV